jgi:hypothetical protein
MQPFSALVLTFSLFSLPSTTPISPPHHHHQIKQLGQALLPYIVRGSSFAMAFAAF